MQRLIAILCAAALLGVGTRADARKMYAGIKGGANWGSVQGEDAPEGNTKRTGILGGGYLGSDVNDQLGVRLEVLYAQKGFEGDIATQDGDVHTGTARIDYVDVPVLFEARLSKGDKLRFAVVAGPSFDFNIKSEVETEDGIEDRKDQTKSFEFAAVVGGDVEYALSSVSLVAEVRYNMGITSLAEDVAGESVDMKNRGIGVMGGIKIPLGGR